MCLELLVEGLVWLVGLPFTNPLWATVLTAALALLYVLIADRMEVSA